MRRLRSSVARSGDRGASAVEYGLMIAAIAAIIVVVAFGLGRTFTNAFHDTCSVMEDYNPLTSPDSEDCGG
jgi:pilus assembly protein Flp/PilA